MSVQKILPIAKKMGKENFLTYKTFCKNSKLTDGKNYMTSLELKGINIMDTVDITLRNKEELPKGFIEVIKEIYKKYFPRSASNEAKKTVVLSSQKHDNDHINSSIVSVTEDEKGLFAHGFLRFEKKGSNLTANIESSCENVLFRLAAILNLPNKNANGRYDINLKLDSKNNILFEKHDDKVKISLSPSPTKEVPYLGIQLEAPNKMFESIFGGELEETLPDLLKKSGFAG